MKAELPPGAGNAVSGPYSLVIQITVGSSCIGASRYDYNSNGLEEVEPITKG